MLRRSLSDYGSIFTRSPAPAEVEIRATCPAVWTSIVAEMQGMFIDKSTTPSQCNDDARAAIRAAFHDCGTWDNTQGATGGCDGSLVYTKYNSTANPISVADLLQVAASVATMTCPGGPKVPTFVGRKDSATPNPENRLPDAHGSGDSLFALFQAKGFTANELAALLGAHSASKAFSQPDIVPGTPQDDSLGIWDVHYYSNTLKPVAGVASFPGDVNLAQHPVVGKEFTGFVNAQGKWNSAYANAMAKMALLVLCGG
ncbi:class II peroxidase [Cadophora sp. DSE1049]|nr:class II peroxidase [Cadophora sp. DSE1049]